MNHCFGNLAKFSPCFIMPKASVGRAAFGHRDGSTRNRTKVRHLEPVISIWTPIFIQYGGVSQ